MWGGGIDDWVDGEGCWAGGGWGLRKRADRGVWSSGRDSVGFLCSRAIYWGDGSAPSVRPVARAWSRDAIKVPRYLLRGCLDDNAGVVQW